MAKLEPGMVVLEAAQNITILGQEYRKGDKIRPLNEVTARRLIRDGIAKQPVAKSAPVSKPSEKEEKQSETKTKEAKKPSASKTKSQPWKKKEGK